MILAKDLCELVTTRIQCKTCIMSSTKKKSLCHVIVDIFNNILTIDCFEVNGKQSLFEFHCMMCTAAL